MNLQTAFDQVMAEQTAMALTTAEGNQPNVRVVNFYYEPASQTLYFSTAKGSHKTLEMADNPHVDFSTIPQTGNAHVKAQGLVKPSKKKLADLAEPFIQKVPAYEQIIERVGDNFTVYEITFQKAQVTSSTGESGQIEL